MSNEAVDPITRIRALDELLMVVDVDGTPQGSLRPGKTVAETARKVGVSERTVSRWVAGPQARQWLTWRLAIDGGATDEAAMLQACGDVRVAAPAEPSGGAPGQPAPVGDPLEGLSQTDALLECLSSGLPLGDALDAAWIERAEWDEWMRVAGLAPSSPELADMDEDERAMAEWCRWLRRATRAAEARCKLALLRSIVTGGSSAAQLQLLGRRWREQFGITAASTGDAGEVDSRPDEELDAIIASAGSGDGPG